MTCCDSVFETSLHYTSPAHGGWGVLKTAQLIPESYHLFVSPAACGRHGALAARFEGRNRKVSYYHLTEQSIVSGDYEEEILSASDVLLSRLTKQGRRPRVFSVFVSCIDDLLGTDLDALTEQLSGQFPDIRFITCHMNPITTDTAVPSAVNIQDKIYSVLEPCAERDSGVNLIGNLQAIRPESELFALLKQMGAQPIRHISDFTRYDDYQSMAKSRLNLVLAPPGKYASGNMEEKLGIPYLMALTAFRPENITETYQRIAGALGAPCPALEKMEQTARKAFCETAEALSGMPVIVDGEAVTRPFELARALLENGISVHAVYEQKLKPSDRKDFEWLRDNRPEIPIRQTLHPKQTERDGAAADCVAIGYSSGYLSGAKHVADIGGQNGLYGYRGVCTLMDLIREASETETDMRSLLKDAVLVI